MRELINLKTGQPFSHAEGRVCIDYTDPVTNKIKEQIKGKNHVYLDSLQCTDWYYKLSHVGLHMTDYSGAIDTSFPYLLGNHVGYGVIGDGSSGTYKGAYSTANSFLAQVNGITSISWKYQYDFTPSQVPSAVKAIGLTNQFQVGSGITNTNVGATAQMPFKTWIAAEQASPYSCGVNGRYAYSCASGIVTCIDLWLNTTTTINISSIVGTSGSMYCGYAPATGYYYIANTSSRIIYVFSDAYTTYITSHPASAMSSFSWGPFYVYNDIAYIFIFGSTAVYRLDFINNTYTGITLPWDSAYFSNSSYRTCGGAPTNYGNYICNMLNNYYPGSIFDLATGANIGCACISNYYTSYPAPIRFPLSDSFMIGVPLYGSSYGQTREFIHNSAYCIYKIPDDAPTRPAGYGMTVTYEVEVTW